MERVTVRGWAFDLDLLYHWKEAGLTCDEVATPWTDAPGSKLVIYQAVPLMLVSLIVLRLVNSPIGRRTPPEIMHAIRMKLGLLAEGFVASRDVGGFDFVAAPPK